VAWLSRGTLFRNALPWARRRSQESTVGRNSDIPLSVDAFKPGICATEDPSKANTIFALETIFAILSVFTASVGHSVENSERELYQFLENNFEGKYNKGYRNRGHQCSNDDASNVLDTDRQRT
jgi:hypothetical protein